MSYAGLIAGAIGALTGIVGAVLGYVGYRRAEQIKALDLRLELRKAASDLRAAVKELPDLLAQAKMSHTNLAAALGQVKSGNMVRWTNEWEADHSAVEELQRQVAGIADDFAALKPEDLEAALVAVHAIAGQAAKIRGKYLEKMANDDQRREQLRAEVRALRGVPDPRR